MLCTCQNSPFSTTLRQPLASSTSTQATTTCFTPSSSLSLRSGHVVFLKTRGGTGKMLHIQGTAVKAMWDDQGDWQAIKIEKPAGGEIQSGDTVFLTGHTGSQIDVEGESVQ